jgi:hypothetical protein
VAPNVASEVTIVIPNQSRQPRKGDAAAGGVDAAPSTSHLTCSVAVIVGWNVQM